MLATESRAARWQHQKGTLAPVGRAESGVPGQDGISCPLSLSGGIGDVQGSLFCLAMLRDGGRCWERGCGQGWQGAACTRRAGVGSYLQGRAGTHRDETVTGWDRVRGFALLQLIPVL